MEHTAGIIETYISLIPVSIKVFEMFQMRLFYYKHNKEEKKVESIFIKCINCDRSTGLLISVKTVKEMRINFVLNKNSIRWIFLG